jgi:hypothetical protein
VVFQLRLVPAGGTRAVPRVARPAAAGRHDRVVLGIAGAALGRRHTTLTGVLTGGILDGAAEAHARALIDQAMLLIGDALRARLEAHLEGAFGPEWPTEVLPRGRRFGRRDLASYAHCLLGDGELRGTREEFWAALGVPLSERVGQRLRAALRVRNAFAHPDRPTRIKQTKDDLGQLLLLARTLDLDCIADLHGIAQQAETLSGEDRASLLSPRQVQELQERAEQLAAESDHHRQQWMTAEAAREHAHDRLVQLQDDLEAARAAQRDAEAHAIGLGQQLADADAASADLQQQLKRATEEADQEATARAAHLAQVEQRMATLQQELEAHDRRVDEAEQLVEAAEADRDDLAGNVAFGAAVAGWQPDAPDDLPAQVEAALARLTEGQGEVNWQEQPFPAPGEAWPYPRGREVWKLSGAARSLTTADGLWSLDELLGTEIAAGVIESFLALRPAGGRVWVDSDGDAVTYINGVLTYLGCLRPDPEDPRWNPPIGTPYPRGRRRYTVTRAGVQRSDGTFLADVIDTARARAVRQRLWALRRKGGVFRVNSTGAVTMYEDGGWVFAGRVRADEWFPGEISDR